MKKHNVRFILGDINSKVGKEGLMVGWVGSVGAFEFTQLKKMVTASTWFNLLKTDSKI